MFLSAMQKPHPAHGTPDCADHCPVKMLANPLSPEQCAAKAAECRALAQRAVLVAHRVMLEHVAETWGRIGAEIETWERIGAELKNEPH